VRQNHFSQKERWMPNCVKLKKDGRQRVRKLCHQLFRAELTKQITNSSQKWTIICASRLQVFFVLYKVELQFYKFNVQVS
jgi:hypothetical protein